LFYLSFNKISTRVGKADLVREEGDSTAEDLNIANRKRRKRRCTCCLSHFQPSENFMEYPKKSRKTRDRTAQEDGAGKTGQQNEGPSGEFQTKIKRLP
jgi:hypothetical protein